MVSRFLPNPLGQSFQAGRAPPVGIRLASPGDPVEEPPDRRRIARRADERPDPAEELDPLFRRRFGEPGHGQFEQLERAGRGCAQRRELHPGVFHVPQQQLAASPAGGRRIQPSQRAEQLEAHRRAGLPGHGQQVLHQRRFLIQSRLGQTDRVFPDSGLRVFEGSLDVGSRQPAQALKRPQGMQPRVGTGTRTEHLPETIDGLSTLAVHQQSLRVSPPPGVGMAQGLHQFPVRSRTQGPARLPWRRSLRFRSDTVDPAVPAALVESLGSPARIVKLVRHPFRVLDDSTVVVHDVEGSVRTHVDEDGPEPMIRGGQKLRLLLDPAGLQGDPALLEEVAVDQVVGRVGHEGGLFVRGGKEAAGIDGDSAGRSEVSDIGQDAMFRVQRDRIDAGG